MLLSSDQRHEVDISSVGDSKHRGPESCCGNGQVLAEGLYGYSIFDHERVQQREDLQQSGRHKVEGLVQQAADTALSRMKDRSATLWFTPPLLEFCCRVQ